MTSIFREIITPITILAVVFFMAACNGQSGGARAQASNLDSADVVYIWS